MGSRRHLPPSFPLFGRQQGAVTPDSTDGLGFDDDDDNHVGQSNDMTPTQQFSLFPPLPNTGDIERRGDFEPLGGAGAFTTPVMAGQLPSQQYYAEMMRSTYAGLDSGSSAGYQHSVSETPLQMGQSKSHLESDYEPLDYMDSLSSPPLPPVVDGDGLYVSGYSTPIPGARGGHGLEGEVEAIDEEFVLNVIQEGELERLTKLAVEETKILWKQEIMGELRKQTDSLADDDWMYQ
ncbi:hypothetical protein FBU31_001299 [Coemansia sp. 'formosensis']|nr:hypothetical protein FBU31_001299 [Coemansia sp. 'formosensis']